MGFILITEYTCYSPKIITFWPGTSFIACLYLLPIFSWLLQKKMKHFSLFCLLGKASFNLFLVQMCFFSYVSNFLSKHIDKRLILYLGNILICCFFGILFYFMEKPITNIIVKKIKSIELKCIKKRNNILQIMKSKLKILWKD